MMPLPTVDVPQPPWTYDSEIALFRAIISYRPVGLHKSLRLVSILNSINSQLLPTDPPITLQDIKSKLDELYDIQGIEEQEDESEETPTEEDRPTTTTTISKEKQFNEFELPFKDLVGFIEDRGKGIDGDCSLPSSPEAVMSVRSGRSGGGRGMKRRREESSAAISNTDAGTDDEGVTSLNCC
jgi:Chromatin modification-related protein EAF7